MNQHAQLRQRAAENRPIRVGLIGAGPFGSMYLAQVPRTPSLHLVALADRAPDQARANLAHAGGNPGQASAPLRKLAIKTGATWITNDGETVANVAVEDDAFCAPRYTAWGQLRPADTSRRLSGLPRAWHTRRALKDLYATPSPAQ